MAADATFLLWQVTPIFSDRTGTLPSPPAYYGRRPHLPSLAADATFLLRQVNARSSLKQRPDTSTPPIHPTTHPRPLADASRVFSSAAGSIGSGSIALWKSLAVGKRVGSSLDQGNAKY